jgi:MoaA/NifB/PqqE/SkfB family radical SAM enzyme
MTLTAARQRVYMALQYRLRDVWGGRLRNACRPVSISLLMTEHCNARCVHCNIWQNKGKEQNPSPEQWRALLRDLAAWLGPVPVTLTGGEALLQPFTPQLVAYGVSQGLSMELLSHGYWSDRSRLEAVALADPWRITMSLDGIGETHSLVRGRENFWQLSYGSLQMLARLRREKNLKYIIRLKTVVMAQNLEGVAEVARFARENGMEVFYQPIEQNYNTAEDPLWFKNSPTWPQSPERAAAVVSELIALKRAGYPIANSLSQLEVMIPYFRDPAPLRIAVQAHHAHEGKSLCAALTTLQLQANGDVTVCTHSAPVGNIKEKGIREIWRERPNWWASGCCQDRRISPREPEVSQLPVIT